MTSNKFTERVSFAPSVDSSGFKMDHTAYKKIRAQLGYTVDEWLEQLGISLSAHQKYMSGQRAIPTYVQNAIRILHENHQLKRELLIRDYRNSKR